MPTHRQLDPEIITVFFPEDGQPFAGINKSANLSRWFIGDLEFDDLVNFIPDGPFLQQTPSVGALIAAVGTSAVWFVALPLNLTTYLYVLGTNGALYQVSLGGVVTTIVAAATLSANCDITDWQGMLILVTDTNASKVYSWNGTTWATVFTSQPASLITVYSGRLWLAYQGTITFTAGGTYNNLGGDGSSFTITETDCTPPIKLLYPYGGNLYVGGFNWIRIYGGLYDTGTPAVLQFQTSTLSDEAGIYTKWSFIGGGYSALYSSSYGIWNLLGSQAVKMSDPMDGFWQNIVLPGSSLSAAFGPILGVPCYMWNFQFSVDSTYRIACLIYDPNPGNRKWFTLQQGNINFITWSANRATGTQSVWGIDTSGNLYQICGGANPVTSQANTKLWSFGSRIRLKSVIRAGVEMVTSSSSTATLSALDENLNSYTPDLRSTNPANPFVWTNAGRTFNWTNSGAFTWSTRGTQYALMEFNLPIYVRKLGLNYSLTGVGGTVGAFAVEYTELPADWGH